MIYLYTYFSRKTFCYSKTQTWNNAKVTWVINLCMDMEERDSCALYMFGHNYKEIHIFPNMVLLIYIEGDSFVFFFPHTIYPNWSKPSLRFSQFSHYLSSDLLLFWLPPKTEQVFQQYQSNMAEQFTMRLGINSLWLPLQYLWAHVSPD